MIERALILLLMVALLALLRLAARRRSLGRARRAPLPSQAQEALRHAGAVILYFSTASCSQCRSLQDPALRDLEHEVGAELAVVPIDAAADGELSSRFGIMTIPATVVLDREGVRAVNLGFASAAVLRNQLAGG